MTAITATTHKASNNTLGRMAALLAVSALLVAALFLAVLAGYGPVATTLPGQELVQQDRVIDQASEPMYFPGRPY